MKGICFFLAVALLMAAPLVLFSAEDGAAQYEAKCSMCHGPKGEGTPAAGLPAVKGTSMTVEQMVTYLTKGDKTKTIHAEPISDVSEAQAKVIAEHVKSMK